MLPVLFSIGKISVSAFGVFLAIGFLVGVFLVWRLSRAWDLDEEKILDLTILTFLGGLIGARLYFVSENFHIFSQNLLRIVLINKYPGFSFWGGFLGGWLTLFFLARARKVDFWQGGDIASVGFVGGLILSSLGCFLGGCGIGIPSKLLIAVHMVGFPAARFPVQLLEAILLVLALTRIWSAATHFHTKGKILSLSLIYVGLIKVLVSPLKQTKDESSILSLVLIFLGLTIFYKVTKRNLISDLRSLSTFVFKLISDYQTQKFVLTSMKKYWYNQTTSFFWKLRNFKKILRKINVKFSQ